MAMATARHILVKTVEEALELKGRIDGGEDFAEMAKAHSECPSGKSGGALGEFRLTLDGERLAVSSLILPENQAEQDPRARLEGRFEAIADLARSEGVDALVVGVGATG